MKKYYRSVTLLSVITLFALFVSACSTQPASQPVSATEIKNSVPASSPPTSAPENTPSSANAVATNTTASNSGTVSFSKDISPILQTSCVSCHGGERTSKGLDLSTWDSLMSGSQNGLVISAGDAANSILIQSVQSGKMPRNGMKLTPDQFQLLVNWVNAGAKNN